MHPFFIDMTGQIIGRLTVVGRADNAESGKARWICQCECGETTSVLGLHLRKKNIQSCGCLQRERASEANSGKGNPRYGKKASSEMLIKMSLSHIGKKHTPEWRLKLRGNTNPNWKGGINPEYNQIRTSIEYRLWREAVFSKDNFTCQQCNVRGGDMEAHHINPFHTHPSLRLAIDNGITYCKRCHKAVHKTSVRTAKKEIGYG